MSNIRKNRSEKCFSFLKKKRYIGIQNYSKNCKLNQYRITHFVENPLSQKPYNMIEENVKVTLLNVPMIFSQRIFVGPGSVRG